ncbi:hypothetical protein PR202_ga06022 [Eleusine coracana subsp. coracana]|uniref:protein-serine/threonine phosphatase n=1 Tax=Eleusine coracana subsp. coracana TaxID=191504 RepID=A0AAV5BUY7_ELECO|nr:hypothetical protein PR202_ga06022 [Eleusine coracana subsp. coracana]
MFPETVSDRTATDAAALLTELAISHGSKDNISVVVVELRRLKGISLVSDEPKKEPARRSEDKAQQIEF